MATILRRRRESQADIGPYRAFELLSGKVAMTARSYNGYAPRSGQGGDDLTPFICDQMRVDWDAHRDGLLELWSHGGHRPGGPPWICLPSGDVDAGEWPWAAEKFDKC